jgi:A/G-specific adenine glycosylase
LTKYSNEQQKLLEWYHQNKRNLPFRKDKNPYKIWVSEVMLQQTRVSAMLPSYEKFIHRFPNLGALARATPEEVLEYWKGLGYYSRALNLRAGAIYLISNYNEKFPRELDQILKVPGIGPYTARAILSIAYDEKYAVLDGNVKRVLARFFEFLGNIKDAKQQSSLQKLADEFLNSENSGDHNQAMMELGATVCTPKPNCLECPISVSCNAFQKGLQNELPKQSKETPKLMIDMVFLILEKEGKVFLEKNSTRRFFKKIYSLPFYLTGKNLPMSYTKMPSYFSQIELEKISIQSTNIKHSITNHQIQIHYSRVDKKNWDLNPEIDGKWVEWNRLIEEFPSSISKKLWNYWKSSSLFTP